MNTTFEAIAHSLFNADRASARLDSGESKESLASDNYMAIEEMEELDFEF